MVKCQADSRRPGFAGACVAILLLTVSSANRAEDLVITAELTPQEPYVQAEAYYTVRLYRRSSFLTGDIVQPAIPDAVTEFVSESEPVDVQRDGERWQLIERRYIVLFQKSGTLQIPAPVYSGRSTFVKGEPTTVLVRPHPEEWQGGWWLPARDLRATEQWRLPGSRLQAGEPIERIVTVSADGLTGAQLPLLPLAEGDWFDVLRTHTETDRKIVGGHITGRRVEHHVIVPREAGTLYVPPLQIQWWSIDNKRARIAQLPAREFQILPGSNSRAVPAPPVGAPLSATEKDSSDTTPTDRASPSGLVLILSIAVLAALAIFGNLAFRSWCLRWHLSLWSAKRRVSAAARRGDPWSARDAVLDLAKVCWSRPPKNLTELGARLADYRAAKAIATLDQALYGRNGGAIQRWEGTEIVRHIIPALSRAVRKRRRNRRLRRRLPPLIPERS